MMRDPATISIYNLDCAMNGLYVEIGNTDAEGRLVMADTMTYVQREFNPK